jgi:hypothetical protein
MLNLMKNSIAVGKYLVSPLSRLTDDGQYTASVSIRTGQGSSTHDRVLRFATLFASQADAMLFATRQGMTWVQHPATR